MNEEGTRSNVRTLAVVADIGGILWITLAAVAAKWMSFVFPLEKIALAGMGIYGLVRIVTAYGLWLFRRWGWTLELLSAIVWVVAPVAYAAVTLRDEKSGSIIVALLIAVASALEIVYLLGRTIRRFFAAPPDPIASRGSLTGWLLAQPLTLAFLIGYVYPSLASMSGRSTQKRTMADLRTIATAVEACSTDLNRYPAALSLDDLERQISPTYLRTMPRIDGWRHGYRYFAWKADPKEEGPHHYAVWSGGSDGKVDYDDPRRYKPGPTTHFECDIVFANGTFIVWPEGVQTQ